MCLPHAFFLFEDESGVSGIGEGEAVLPELGAGLGDGVGSDGVAVVVRGVELIGQRIAGAVVGDAEIGQGRGREVDGIGFGVILVVVSNDDSVTAATGAGEEVEPLVEIVAQAGIFGGDVLVEILGATEGGLG